MSKTRSIFEDVADKPAAAEPPAAGAPAAADRRGIAVWLAILFALIVAMIVVGGMTRLTESGLSITEWRPVTGALPPTTPEAWTAEFEKYRATPQYEALNRGMTLDEFKSIYWWEWGHRQLGRAIGAVWGVGFLWFWLRRRIPPGWTPRLLGARRRSAGCKARSAGGWSAPASPPGWTRSPRTGSPSISASPSCCSG